MIHKIESHRLKMQRDLVVVILYGIMYTSIIPSGIVPANFRLVAPCPAEHFVADIHRTHLLLKCILLALPVGLEFEA